MNIQSIINSIRVGNVATPIPDPIASILSKELPLADRAYSRLVGEGTPPHEARLVATGMAIMHALGMRTEEVG